jgi:hypothetical protein
VSDAGCFGDADGLEFDVTAAEMLEQPPSLAQENRDQMNLQFVEHACAQEGPRKIGAVHHDALAPAALLASRIALSTPSVT